ncbi:hypothetical protein [Novosphingobium subterraneum]|uniref:hypothetical protein n=1 Tax=Novosphingobium subterraneum TaxID=48936 RepID=UPI0012E0876B|nr:hypothetical protein [Novosphingobium subterraneum]
MAAGASVDGSAAIAAAEARFAEALVRFAGFLRLALRAVVGRRFALFPLATLRGFFDEGVAGASGHGMLAITAPRGAGRIR